MPVPDFSRNWHWRVPFETCSITFGLRSNVRAIETELLQGQCSPQTSVNAVSARIASSMNDNSVTTRCDLCLELLNFEYSQVAPCRTLRITFLPEISHEQGNATYPPKCGAARRVRIPPSFRIRKTWVGEDLGPSLVARGSYAGASGHGRSVGAGVKEGAESVDEQAAAKRRAG